MFDWLFKKRRKEAQTDDILPRQEENCDYEDVTPIAKFFKEETGINFDAQLDILKSKMKSFCRIRYIRSFDECLQRIQKESSLKQELINHLTTNETYFYREFQQIRHLIQSVQNKHGRIDILCAPCASGEEPYSIAIALLEAGLHPEQLHIVGIDISQGAIDAAKKALYRERNIKNLSNDILNKYFTFEDNHYRLHDDIKKLVTFRQFNIFDGEFKQIGKFDYIFSRNMLIYFDKERKKQAKEILESMLKERENKVYFGHADLF